MRTLALALSLALVAAVAHVPDAAACGGGYRGIEQPAFHTAEGQAGHIYRNERGELVVFISYPVVDGQQSMRYGDFYILREDRVAHQLEQELARDRRRNRARIVRLQLERRGERAPWRVAMVKREA